MIYTIYARKAYTHLIRSQVGDTYASPFFPRLVAHSIWKGTSNVADISGQIDGEHLCEIVLVPFTTMASVLTRCITRPDASSRHTASTSISRLQIDALSCYRLKPARTCSSCYKHHERNKRVNIYSKLS